MTQYLIMSLSDARATLETVGGKGASLARLAGAGIPVPDGFHVTTAAYQQFVEANGLQERIAAIQAQADPAVVASLEAASQAIQALFAGASIPADISAAIAAAYEALALGGQAAVAVRSSATAEDLPGLSFAGQQETYLNVRGTKAVVEAVKRCWASLWTARAIGYRAQHGIPSDTISLAVVVQVLVPAEVSGVMFTANPATGNRNQAMISAAWGLGETIVGGLVTPDTITTEKATGKIVERQTAEKTVRTVTLEHGTREEALPEALRLAEALTDEQAAALTRLGNQIEQLYGTPMDVEWTLAAGELAIVQARPITALPAPQVPPPSKWELPNPKNKYGRGSIVDLLPDPLSPLFHTLGMRVMNVETRKMYAEMTNKEDWPIEVYSSIQDYVYIRMTYPPVLFWQVFMAGFRMLKDISKGGEQGLRDDAIPTMQRAIERWSREPVETISAARLLEGACDLFEATVHTYTILQTGVIPAASMTEMKFTQVYNRLIKKPSDPEAVIFLLGLDSAPLRAEKSLYDLANWVREHPDLAAYLTATNSLQIAADLSREDRPGSIESEVWQEMKARLEAYIHTYGQTIYDLDFSKPVQSDDPSTVLDALRLYVTGEGRSPNERVREQEIRREQVTQAILARLHWPRRNWFESSLKSAQKNAPGREDGLASLGLCYPLLRKMLLELGRRLAQANTIQQPDDVFWITEDELEKAAVLLDQGKAPAPRTTEVAERKALWNAEKSVTPPTMLPEKSTFYGLDIGNFGARTSGQEGDTIRGIGAYPGKITGVARVLRGPEDFGEMRKGDILVASITTPAWTPLFAMASAIVTDIGGPLSHSSIVAREYGIPAVLGAGVATRRIRSGQTITVDGNTGLVHLNDASDGREPA